MDAVYENRDAAPVSDKAKAALKLIETMTLRPEALGPADVDEARRAGVSDAAILDCATVCALFNVIDRLADAFGFHVPDQRTFDAGAAAMVKRGYALPAPLRVLPQS